MSSSPAWTLHAADGPLFATAIHHGHVIRPDVAELASLDKDTRLREEDPHTGRLAAVVPNHVVVHRSRFEVDLNRPREAAVYRTPDEAWGLECWRREPEDGIVEESLRLYDGFYRLVGVTLQTMIERYGRFLLLDIHSYNHRRAGADAEADDPAGSPTINLGTGSLPSRWRPVADAFVSAAARGAPGASPIDVGENVRFQGGHLATWVNERYGDHGCALAIECKKVYMDEWTATLDREALELLADTLGAIIRPLGEALARP